MSFPFPTPSAYEASKCFFTYGQMGHVDPQQLPERTKPWASLGAQKVVHRVDLVLPDESYQALAHDKVLEQVALPQFYRVTMSLRQILEGAFFTEYIKLGSILMISRPKDAGDDAFTVHDGKLTMLLRKETYQRAGLVGAPHGVRGKREVKPLWIVEFDLKSPTMAHGKKGFDRLLYACNEAFSSPATWLLCNLGPSPLRTDPLAQHSPIKFTASQSTSHPPSINIPALSELVAHLAGSIRDEAAETASEVYEWLSLVRLGSPRILSTDHVDAYLSTYDAPPLPSTAGDGFSEFHSVRLHKITWSGFVSPRWVRNLLADMLAHLPSKTWFSLTSSSFGREGGTGDNVECTFLRPPNSAGQYALWEIKRDG